MIRCKLADRDSLRAERTARGITLSAVARCSGTAIATVCRAETGEWTKLSTIRKIERGYAVALGRPLHKSSLSEDETEVMKWVEAQVQAFVRERFQSADDDHQYPVALDDLRRLVQGTVFVWKPRK